MHRRLILLSMLTVLAACASHPAATSHQPYLAAPLKDVTLKDSLGYWSLDAKNVGAGFAAAPKANGCFRAEVIIDSNGDVFEPKLRAAVGQDMTDWVPGFLAHVHYLPASSNPGRTPIRTTLSWSFSSRSVTLATTAATTTEGREKIEKMEQQGPPPESQAWHDQCEKLMDEQMGITRAPAATTTAPTGH